MSVPCFLVLKSGVTLEPDDVLPMLAAGATEDQLCAAAADLPRLFYLLERLRRANLLEYELRRGGEALARVLPLSGEFQFQPLEFRAGAAYVLSRFAYLRREADGAVLESPLVQARVVLNGRAAGEVILALARPWHPSGDDDASGLAGLLADTGFLEEAGAPEPSALGTWEFHDLLFHARSRMGRAPGGFGGTYRFQGRREPLPALKPPMSDEPIPLYRPDLEKPAREDPPFTRVLESRRSMPDAAAAPLTCVQLGEFLYRTAHIQQVVDARPQQLIKRAYPAAGAIHELEFYLAVHACEGLAGGLYHYHAGMHALYRLSAADGLVQQLLDDAVPRPHVLIILASRFGRVAWKYEGMAYRLTLLNAGVVIETMYLVATAMGLAPCALGNGDPALFAAASGIDALEETSVAEFALSGKCL